MATFGRSGRVRPRRQQKPGQMNKTEAAYAERLAFLRAGGEIRSWRFEPIKFRLADKTFYTPDFMVVTEDEIQFHEIKGWRPEDDANVKIKVVAEMYPEFAFQMVFAEVKRGELRITKVREYGA
jgi:hypothetical protein